VIRVDVAGLHSDTGTVNCALFGSADGFPLEASKALRQDLAKIENGKASCTFRNVTAGDYAVAVFHDENSSGKLDRNFLGIPKEGVGASNGAVGRFGPPKFDDARFNYSGGPTVLTINIHYLTAPL